MRLFRRDLIELFDGMDTNARENSTSDLPTRSISEAINRRFSSEFHCNVNYWRLLVAKGRRASSSPWTVGTFLDETQHLSER